MIDTSELYFGSFLFANYIVIYFAAHDPPKMHHQHTFTDVFYFAPCYYDYYHIVKNFEPFKLFFITLLYYYYIWI